MLTHRHTVTRTRYYETVFLIASFLIVVPLPFAIVGFLILSSQDELLQVVLPFLELRFNKWHLNVRPILTRIKLEGP